MYACVHTCVPNIYSHVTVHIFNMSLNKYGCTIANMSHTASMLYGHIEPTLLHKCALTQATAIFTSHVIAMYVPVKFHLYAKYTNLIMCTWHSCVSINKSYECTAINNVTRSTGIHFTLLAYAPKQCLPHCIHMPHCTTTVVYIIYRFHIQVKIPNCKFSYICANNKYAPLMSYIYHMPIIFIV